MNQYDKNFPCPWVAGTEQCESARDLAELRARQELDAQRELWHRKFLAASGREACYKRALEAVCNVYPHTSAAGDMMARYAHEALDREYTGR